MTIGRFRLSVTSDGPTVSASGLPADLEEVLLRPESERSDAERSSLLDQFLSTAPELAKANEEIAALRRSMPRQPTTMVMQERLPEHARTTHVHKRGAFLKPTEPVEPGTPAVLHDLPK